MLRLHVLELRAYWDYQFNCVKEMSLSETAEAFHSAGFNVLLYDARSVGGSEGLPRNQIDPAKMVEDISGTFCCRLVLRSNEDRS